MELTWDFNCSASEAACCTSCSRSSESWNWSKEGNFSLSHWRVIDWACSADGGWVKALISAADMFL